MSEQSATKVCGVCQRSLDVDRFYRKTASPDGLASPCKACQARYDRGRLHAPHRIEARRIYAGTARGKAAKEIGSGNWISANPAKYFAHNAVSNALRDGRIFKPTSCSACGGGKNVAAHHDDYDRPLDVRWLCVPCHAAHHRSVRSMDRLEAILIQVVPPPPFNS